MERQLLQQLSAWKESGDRKPLLLHGIRRTGKTWLLREFGRRCYENTACFNLEKDPEYRQFFETAQNADDILSCLMMAGSQRIMPEKTLVIFDGIQDCPGVINAMKYFCEEAPQYHIACASLPGTALAKQSIPAGSVQLMQLDPMTFTEFLAADGDDTLLQYLDSADTIEPVQDAFFNPLCEKLKMYLVTGGMPEAVLRWTHDRDAAGIDEALSRLVDTIKLDFGRHPKVSDFAKISRIWNSVPSQLARKNKKFVYKAVQEGARAREYGNALQWLVNARLVHKVYRSSQTCLPLSLYDDLSTFKLYLADVGILRSLYGLSPTVFRAGNRLFTEFKGALTENFVLQSLAAQFKVMPRYWSQCNPPYEVDFLLQRENDIFPAEVKSDTNVRSRSLKKFRELFPDQCRLRIRFSLGNLDLNDDLLNIPLFMVDQTDRLIGLALKEKDKR
ncbi:MAG: DUF4143 domain-containing protein [Desulfovibrionaceae bacterium]|nr:DUF4143 domain-containing protein [Desulfovibrionaceae bacterium]